LLQITKEYHQTNSEGTIQVLKKGAPVMGSGTPCVSVFIFKAMGLEEETREFAGFPPLESSVEQNSPVEFPK